MLDNVVTKEVKSVLELEKYFIVKKILKEENSTSILASLNDNLIKKYLEISINSKNIFFYICEHKNEIVGYALLARKPSFLISEFKELKYSILISLLLKIKLKTIVNIILSMYKIDLLLISRINKNLINENLNLNLLAINKSFQSKGIGKIFVFNILQDIKKKYNFQIMTVETNGKRAVSFYQDKLEFKYIGKKLRFFKNMCIFKKNC
jgi:hypothetical protein